MTDTPNFKFPYIMPAQAQKHVTHNEAVRMLDALVQISVLDRDLQAPPATPAEGERYIVGSAPSGDWTGHASEIAAWQDGAWAFYAPKTGWLVWIDDETRLVVWMDGAWVLAGPAADGAAIWGINTPADVTNRLAVAAPATLLTNNGGGHQLKINKASAGDPASVLYQTGFSGRAEMGLTGDDDYRFKVSPDGATWHEAIVVDKDTGAVTFPNTTLGGGGPSTLISITDFGASTSASAATNTTAFTDAIAAAATAGQGVHIPGGTYTINAISIPAGVRLYSDGGNATLTANAGVANLLTITGSNVRIEGLNLACGGNVTGAAILIDTTTAALENIAISDVRITNPTDGLKDAAGSGSVEELVLDHITVLQPSGTGFRLEDATQGFVFAHRCHVDFNGTATNAPGFQLTNCDGLQITECHVLGSFTDGTSKTAQHGFHLVDIVTLWATDCYADTMGGNGWLLDYVENVYAKGCGASQCGLSGIKVDDAAGTPNRALEWRGYVKGRVGLGTPPTGSHGFELESIDGAQLDVRIEKCTGNGIDATDCTNVQATITAVDNAGYGISTSGVSSGIYQALLNANTAGPTNLATTSDIVVGTNATSALPTPTPAGTAITAAVHKQGDLDTGIYFPSDDTLALTAGGTQYLQVSADGLKIPLNLFFWGYRAGAAGTAWATDGSGNFVVATGATATLRCWVSYTDGSFNPYTDNAYSLGQSGYRWSEVHAATGTINTSDARSKLDITPCPLGLAFINQLEPVTYRRKDAKAKITSGDRPDDITVTRSDGQRMHTGFLAQQVKASLPAGYDWAGWCLDDPADPDSTQSLRESYLIAPAITAIQELDARLQSAVAELDPATATIADIAIALKRLAGK